MPHEWDQREFLAKCKADLSLIKQGITVGRSQIIQSLLAVVDGFALLGHSLETLPELQNLIESYLARPPWCPACHKAMRLVSANPDKKHPKLRHVIFVCDCGRKSDQLVAARRGRRASA